jgi:hypothetical protein
MQNSSKKIIAILYPPHFDGELHIDVTETDNYFAYYFQHAKIFDGTCREHDSWETLVAAARAIVAQNERRKKS